MRDFELLRDRLRRSEGREQTRVLTNDGIVEQFNGTVRGKTDNDYGDNYLQAEATIATLMRHYNEERLHATLGYMTPSTWHRGQPDQVRERRAGQLAGARAHRKTINQQRLDKAAEAVDAIWL